MKLTVITIGENNFSDKDRDLIAKLIDNETHKAAGRQNSKAFVFAKSILFKTFGFRKLEFV